MPEYSYAVKDWKRFQHFKNRSPPWVKLYRDLLEDPDWHELDASAAKTLVLLWLIASEDKDRSGKLPSVERMAFRLRTTQTRLNQELAKLSHWLIRDDITAISPRYHGDTPETETERERETEGEADAAREGAPADSEQEWIDALRERYAKIGVDVDREAVKCKTWCESRNRRFTKRMFVNWLGRADSNMPATKRPAEKQGDFGL